MRTEANLICSHGRDHKLCVWKIQAEDEASLDKTLPVDAVDLGDLENRRQPQIVHSLPVNALNFCAFSMTFLNSVEQSSSEELQGGTRSAVLFAVPNALDSGGIDIFHLPSGRRVSTIASEPSIKTGMVMAVNLFLFRSGDVNVVSAYEDGHVMAFVHRGPISSTSFDIGNLTSNPWKWERVYTGRPHSQPVLSLDTSPMHEYFITSAADSLIIKHPITSPSTAGYVSATARTEGSPLKIVNTKHSGQQGLRIRDDGKVFATAGWDSRVRVYSGKTMKELAVLKWHKEGCYAVTFGEVNISGEPGTLDQALSTQEQSDEAEQTPVPRTQSFSPAAVQNQRNLKVQQTHWLAAGSKDGKISLWDIY